MIIALRYDTMYCYDVVGYSYSDVTSGTAKKAEEKECTRKGKFC